MSPARILLGRRRCDARCWSSRAAGCRCICEGQLHGLRFRDPKAFDRELERVRQAVREQRADLFSRPGSLPRSKSGARRARVGARASTSLDPLAPPDPSVTEPRGRGEAG